MVHFSDEIIQSGYDHTKELVRIRWDRPVDYSLLVKMIIKSQDYENTHLLKKPQQCGFFILYPIEKTCPT